MKYVVLLCDGASDLPCEALNGRTPLTVANKPNMDKIAETSQVGLVKTVAEDLNPGSDVANLSVLGYNPKEYYTGRSPLEAASIGVSMRPDDVSFRCNLVTLSREANFRDKTMLSYCADDISTEEAEKIIEKIEANFGDNRFKFYSGISYRHCLIRAKGVLDVGELTPPHDITGRKIADYLNANENGKELIELMEKSSELLKDEPKANSIWLWGEGKSAKLPSFKGKYGLNAAMISAVDLLKGIGKLTGMDVIEVNGATGYIDTNFAGKANAALNALKNGADLAYIHVEAPDECGHRGEVLNKVKSIELIDELVLKPILEAFATSNEQHGEPLKILIAPDHPTPLSLKTHTREPVPFIIYDNRLNHKGVNLFDEASAKSTGLYINEGYTLMERFING